MTARTSEPMPAPAARPRDAAEVAQREPDAGREPMTLERAKTVAVLTTDDVADLVGLNRFTVYRNKQIPGRIRGIGSAVRFSAKVVLAWLNGEADASKPTRAR